MFSIDTEYETLIPPLTDDEYKRLEKSIVAEGVREPIITWDGTIIDGHNRYKACIANGIPCPNTERTFSSREAAKIWIIENQFGRRNLSKYDRATLALQLEPLYQAEAKRRMSEGGGDKKSGTQKSAEPISDKGETRDKLAELAGMSHDTIRKVKTIEAEADKGNPVAIEVRDELRRGEKKSIHGAYVKVVGKDTPRKPEETIAPDGRKICHMCGEPIDEGEAHSCRPNVHKKCEQEYQRDWEREKRKAPKLPDPDKVLRGNVPVYNISSLLAELEASADMLREAWAESVTINEGMGVLLTDSEKNRLENATANLYEAIREIKKEHHD